MQALTAAAAASREELCGAQAALAEAQAELKATATQVRILGRRACQCGRGIRRD